MKKIILSLAVLTMTVVTVNAQLLVGGSLGMNVSKNEEGNLKSTNFSMSAVPVVGYAIDEHWEVGASLLLGGSVSDQTQTIMEPFFDEETQGTKFVEEEENMKIKYFNWSFAPYARYYFFNRNKWQIGIHGEANVGGRLPIDAESSDMAVIWGLNFMPVVTYSPKEHWVVIASCGFLGVGLNGVDKNCSFGLNVMNGGASQIGLGFAYKF